MNESISFQVLLFSGLARFEKFYGIMNAPGTTPDQIEIDLRYLDPTLPNFYDQLRALDSKYAESHGKTFNEKVLVVDMTTQAMTQKVLDQVCKLWFEYFSSAN